MKIGVFGGSFNPVHSEHVKTVKAAIDYLQLDKLFVVPAKLPPHKRDEKLESGNNRVDMLKLAFLSEPRVEISTFELDSEGVSYTYLTLEHFKETYPQAELFFLVGTDMLADFPSWAEPKRILELATLLVTPRTGENTDEAVKSFGKLFSSVVAVSPHIGADVSSTRFKAYYKLGLFVKDMLPDKCLDYIRERGLYAADNCYKYVASVLPKKRLIHTAGVIVLAKSLARRLKIDKFKAEYAALIHDVAKYQSVLDYPNFTPPKDTLDCVMHQYLGAYIAKNVLKIDDEEILEAIRFHSTGKPNMSMLAKVLFIADLIEENRDFEGVDKIRKRVKENFDEGFCFALSELTSFLKNSGEPFCPLTENCFEFYCKK